MRNSHLGKVFVVDDDPQLLQAISMNLHLSGYDVHSFSSGYEMLPLLCDADPDVVVSDVMMPKYSGMELLEEIHRLSPDTPVILMTGSRDVDFLAPAVRSGAADFLLKPCSGNTIIESVKRGVDRKAFLRKTREDEAHVAWLMESTRNCVNNGEVMNEMALELISILMVASEMRDDDTGTHIFRIGRFTARILEELGLSKEIRDMIAMASLMHDIGKVGIPDAILLKPGQLSSVEFEIIKRHTLDGARILGASRNPVLKKAAAIALTHHERWDGSGYPYSLRGEAIPLEGRVVMLVDQYDALRSKRVYKEAFSHEQVCQILTEGDGVTETAHFDPAILAAFVSCAADFDNIFNRYNGDHVRADNNSMSVWS